MALRIALWSVTAIYWVILFILTHLPVQGLPKTNVDDKTMHLVAYGVLGMLVLPSCWVGAPRPRVPLWGILLALLSYGAMDELLQIPVGRSCEFGDWLADATGVGIATMILLPLRSRLARVGAPAPLREIETVATDG